MDFELIIGLIVILAILFGVIFFDHQRLSDYPYITRDCLNSWWVCSYVSKHTGSSARCLIDI